MVKSIYIHIPFCETICTYCDFCKIFYNKKYIIPYLNSLNEEIESSYNDEEIQTLYIGGGTPSSLSIEELDYLFKILKKIKLYKDYEFTFECNIENINEEKLKLLFNNGVNRLSIGIQTFNEKHLSFLGRKHTYKETFKIIETSKKIGFKNINIDLMYAFSDQTLEELEEDLEHFLKLDVNHISIYSLIIEPHTKLYIDKVEPIDEDLDYQMYNLIENKLTNNGYIHYEISNYSKPGYESKHNLNYWNNGKYYGFGLGASGYINNIRYTNTRNLKHYIDNNYNRTIEEIDDKLNLEYEFILGFRKLEGINKKEFYDKFKININEINQIQKLIINNKLIDDGENIKLNCNYIYTSNDILLEFIDD